MNDPRQDKTRPGEFPNPRSTKKVRRDDDLVDHPHLGARDITHDNKNNDDDLLPLSLSTRKTPPPQPPRRTLPLFPINNDIQSPLPIPTSHPTYQQGPFLSLSPPNPPSTLATTPSWAKRWLLPKQKDKTNTVPAPFPWATTQRATVHSVDYLLSNRIETITGELRCKNCEQQYELGFNLMDKFDEVRSFVAQNKATMQQRAPMEWMKPVLPTCRFCEQENSAIPVVAAKKKEINWLFLLLGQMLGCCSQRQLRYFCKHTGNPRDRTKIRVLYLTYLGLCKQLDPTGPYDP